MEETNTITVPISVQFSFDFTKIRTALAECSDLLDRLESSLDSAEKVMDEISEIRPSDRTNLPA